MTMQVKQDLVLEGLNQSSLAFGAEPQVTLAFTVMGSCLREFRAIMRH